MTKEQVALLELAKIGAGGDCCISETALSCDWQELFRLACQQGVACVCWKGIEILFQRTIDYCPSALKLQWYVHTQQVMKQNEKMFENSVGFAKLISPIRVAVLKGLDYARYWPNPFWREFGDLDCFVIDGDTYSIDRKARELGIKVEDEDYKHSQIRYDKVNVENHHSFTSFGGSKESRVLEEELRKLFKVSSSTFQDSSLLSPSLDFTAVFMLAHAQGHFLYEGMSLRHILDWHFFLTKEGGNLDWQTVKPVLKKTGLIPFTALMTKFCVQYFGLNTDLDCSLCNDDLMNRFTEDLFGNKFNDNDRRLWMIVKRMMNRYGRLWRFRTIARMPFLTSVVRSVAYSSIWHRKPTLD